MSEIKAGNDSVKAAWHKARSRKITKLPLREDPKDPVKVTGYKNKISMKEGPSLKEWCRIQVQQKTIFAQMCKEWLSHKDGDVERAAKALRMKTRGGKIKEIGRATHTSRRAKSVKS